MYDHLNEQLEGCCCNVSLALGTSNANVISTTRHYRVMHSHTFWLNPSVAQLPRFSPVSYDLKAALGTLLGSKAF
jgi:hypothetical protein